MKKLSVIAALLVAAALLVSCGTTAETAKAAEPAPAAAPAADEGFPIVGSVEGNTFVLENNHQYGVNYQFQGTTGQVLDKAYKAKKGDKIHIHIEGVWSDDIVFGKDDHGNPLSLMCWIVDCSPAASYWTPISEQWVVQDPVKGGEPWVFDYTFEITGNAKAKAGARGADVTFASADAQKVASTLTTTVFTYEITR